ncbi:MAG: VCBS repeat-containing protein, partial [Acidobacteria bacterium]|nr:VCBS repeat-containing protein [Acidobacteriota bacterium]
MWRMSSQAKFRFITVSLICAFASGFALIPQFEDKSEAWGLARNIVYGDSKSTHYLIETTGTGLAILDFDGDHKNDLLILNGARIGEKQEYPPLLYKNLGGDKFEEAGAKSGLAGGGWSQAACSGDIDNDGDV